MRRGRRGGATRRARAAAHAGPPVAPRVPPAARRVLPDSQKQQLSTLLLTAQPSGLHARGSPRKRSSIQWKVGTCGAGRPCASSGKRAAVAKTSRAWGHTASRVMQRKLPAMHGRAPRRSSTVGRIKTHDVDRFRAMCRRGLQRPSLQRPTSARAQLPPPPSQAVATALLPYVIGYLFVLFV